ncbi:porin [Escherichia coli]
MGSFDYGRNLGALYDVEAWTDMFQKWWRLLGADRQLYDQTRQRSGDVLKHRLSSALSMA